MHVKNYVVRSTCEELDIDGDPIVMRNRTSFAALAALFAANMMLAACDDSEQGRIKHYEQGMYQGKADTQLTSEQRDALRRRTAGQSGS